MEAPQAGEVTNLLLAWQGGDEQALRGLMNLVFQDLHRAAHRYLRFFGGLSVEDTAAAMKVSQETVMREWKLAKAWLLRETSRGKRDGS